MSFHYQEAIFNKWANNVVETDDVYEHHLLCKKVRSSCCCWRTVDEAVELFFFKSSSTICYHDTCNANYQFIVTCQGSHFSFESYFSMKLHVIKTSKFFDNSGFCHSYLNILSINHTAIFIVTFYRNFTLEQDPSLQVLVCIFLSLEFR